jgi:predicted DCC family thiol-disulfide oxidoreductase YuxK
LPDGPLSSPVEETGEDVRQSYLHLWKQNECATNVIIMAATLIIFYNTRCPICDAGISYQRRKLINLVKQGVVEFRDINLEPDALAAHNVSVEDIRRRLHALDADGQLVVGADVAIALWGLTPGQTWLPKAFGNSIIFPLTRFGYNRFVDLLYAWNRWMGHW